MKLVTPDDLLQLGFKYDQNNKQWSFHTFKVKIFNGTPKLYNGIFTVKVPLTVEVLKNLIMCFYGDYPNLIKYAKRLRAENNYLGLDKVTQLLTEKSNMPQLDNEINLIIQQVWPELL